MWQTVIIALCVAVCLLYVACRLYRVARGGGCACAGKTSVCSGRCAGCTHSCPSRVPEERVDRLHPPTPDDPDQDKRS